MWILLVAESCVLQLGKWKTFMEEKRRAVGMDSVRFLFFFSLEKKKYSTDYIKIGEIYLSYLH